MFDNEPTNAKDIVEVAAVTESLSKREDLRNQISNMGGHLSNQDVVAAVLIGLVASIPSTPYDNQAAAWFANKTGIALPEYKGEQSVAQAGMTLLKTAQNGGIPNLGSIATIKGEKPAMLNTLLINTAKGKLNNAEGVAESLAQVFDFEDILGLALATLLTNQYVKHFKLEAGTLRYHEFKALTFGIQGIVSSYWNFNPFVIGLSLWHLGKSLWIGNKSVALYVELTEVALEEGRQALAKWKETLESGKWIDITVGTECSGPILTFPDLADSDGFGD